MNSQNQPNNGGDNCCNSKNLSQNSNLVNGVGNAWPAGPVAIGAALLSSACCWLPLALLGLGVSAAGLSKFILGARWGFVAIAAAALGLGFYVSYHRTAACATGEACAPSSLARFNRAMLWVSAVLVLAFTTFPYYSTPLLQAFNGGPQNNTKTPSVSNSSTGPARAAIARLTLYAYQIKGMDCRECANGLQAAIARLPGVKKSTVSYQLGTAQVLAKPHFDPQTVVKTIGGIGYKTILEDGNAINTPAK